MPARQFSPEHPKAAESSRHLHQRHYGRLQLRVKECSPFSQDDRFLVFFATRSWSFPRDYALNITLHITRQDLPRCAARIFSR